jgi:hypothetical protein
MSLNSPENVLSIEASGRVVTRYDRPIGSILAEEGKLGDNDIKQVMELQQAKGLRFGEAAQRLGLITDDDVRCAVAKQYDLPLLLPGNDSVSRELVVAYELSHPCAEELRGLRTQLSMRGPSAGAGRRALVVASPGSGEGRSWWPPTSPWLSATSANARF